MCGILGSAGIEVSSALLETLCHRGPDGRGVECIEAGGERVWLGHTRLAILDLSPAGHQPMPSRDGRWWVTFNGEIYNHLDLRKRLAGPFRGHSDTETLVELLAAQGIEKTLPQLNGMFAFAALDVRQERLHLARDPFGIKPLYFAKNKNAFAFASEIRALKALGLGGGISPAGLRQFLTLRYVPSPATLWQGIERLPAGHALALDIKTDSIDVTPYVQATRDRFNGSIEEATDEYQKMLTDAVNRQLLSDVPVGLLLSGGVDSALVAAMARDAGTNLPCFTVGFVGGHAECEIADARHTAKVLDMPFEAVIVTPEGLRNSLSDIVQAVEEPLGTTSVMPMWDLARRAQEDVTVVLTGQGTDEPWGGYFRYQVELLREGLRMPWAWKLARQVFGLAPQLPEALERGLRAAAETDASRRIEEACALFSATQRRNLVGDEDDGGVGSTITRWLSWLDSAGPLSGAERMMRLDARMNLADDLLLYGDKISMAVSLEARVPMLDLELVRFVESLPIEYRIRWRRGKIVHKRMAERYLPREIVHRPKKGFQVPFGEWSRNAWKTWVESLLLEELDELLNRDAVERLWKEHLRKKPDRSRQIFSLLMLALWHRAHLRKGRAQAPPVLPYSRVAICSREHA